MRFYTLKKSKFQSWVQEIIRELQYFLILCYIFLEIGRKKNLTFSRERGEVRVTSFRSRDFKMRLHRNLVTRTYPFSREKIKLAFFF